MSDVPVPEMTCKACGQVVNGWEAAAGHTCAAPSESTAGRPPERCPECGWAMEWYDDRENLLICMPCSIYVRVEPGNPAQ